METPPNVVRLRQPEDVDDRPVEVLRTGDRVRIDLRRGTADMLVDADEIVRRRSALEAAGGYAYPASQTPWQAMQRAAVGQMHTGAILEGAEAFQRIAQTRGVPRDNH